jgi:hypothetical protein
MNYLERCLKRLEQAEDIKSIANVAYTHKLTFSELTINYFSFRDGDYYAYFRDVKIPLSKEEAKKLYDESYTKYNLLLKKHQVKALEDL